MPEPTLAERIRILEQRVDDLAELPARVASLELKISQFQEEMRGEFSAVRVELREQLREQLRDAGGQLRTEMRESEARLQAEMRLLIHDTQTQMRVLHEDAIARIAVLGEGKARRKSR